MDLKSIEANEIQYLLDYETIVQIAPVLKDSLTKENSFEFARELYEFTKMIYDTYKNEKIHWIDGSADDHRNSFSISSMY